MLNFFVPPTRPGSAGWLPGRNFLSRYLQKKANTPRRARKKAHSTTGGQLLYVTGSISLGRKSRSPLCTRPFRQSSHCLHLPNLPTPPTFHAVASHSLLVPRNLMPFNAPTAANISSYLVISAAKTHRTFRLDKNTSR